MDRIRVGVLQLSVVREDAAKNSRYVGGEIRDAARGGCDVIVLPELWNAAFPLLGPHVLVDEKSGIVEEIAGAAFRTGTWIIAGSMAMRTPLGPRNRCLVFSPEGNIFFRYDKIHLYPGLREPNILSPGSKLGFFDLDGIPCGVMICFDAEFPEVASALSRKGARILFVPGAWKSEYIRLWRAILLSRAIENQVFVVGVNRCDRGKESSFGGHSMVIDPYGDVLLHLDDSPRFQMVNLDLGKTISARREHKVIDSRRPGVYRRWN
ncbi:MAG TPA: nitrilase-related carbon-nitrogen hydrolase [Synergistales bacterium]|nr:nitrilase-related carbon-nitrogen hydrolase [Synergistales bacterium]HRV70486.1 nitrilase-related carbon-nitrogen hydrolase [Thermovirgaceae bacterium]